MNNDASKSVENQPSAPTLTIRTLALYARQRCLAMFSGGEYIRRCNLFNRSIPPGDSHDRYRAALVNIVSDPDPVNFFMGVIWLDSHGYSDYPTQELSNVYQELIINQQNKP